jgi:hypothetical protein
MDRMGMGDCAAWLVINRCLEILNQGAITPHVYRLGAMADGENRLLEVEGILKQELIDGCAAGIGLAAFRDWILAKSLWVHIETAAGKQNSLNTEEQTGDAVRSFMQGNNDWGYAD